MGGGEVFLIEIGIFFCSEFVFGFGKYEINF